MHRLACVGYYALMDAFDLAAATPRLEPEDTLSGWLKRCEGMPLPANDMIDPAELWLMERLGMTCHQYRAFMMGYLGRRR